MSQPPLLPLVTLEGRFVRLVPMSLQYLEDLCEFGLDPELWKLSMPMIRTRDDMQRYIETALREREEGKSLPFVTIEKTSGKAVGSSRYGNIAMEHRRLEIGWTWIAPVWQRTAVNTEAKLLMLTHAFEQLHCMRVEFKTDSLNERSQNALKRIGAKQEGIFRNHMITPSGRIRHSVYFSITDEEWPVVKRSLETKLAQPRF